MIHKLALGTVQFGLGYGIANNQGQTSFAEVCKILNFAKESGITTLDTAIGYGESELVLGRAGIDAFSVVSKVPEFPAGANIQWFVDQCKQSLDRLGINQLDALLLHRSEQLLGDHYRLITDGLSLVQQQGLVRKVGLSIYSPSLLDELSWDWVPDVVQAPFNVLDRRIASSGWLAKLKKNRSEVHARSLFLQGLMLQEEEKMSQWFPNWSHLWRQWHQWLQEENLTALQACMAVAMNQPMIDKVLVGVECLEHLECIVESTTQLTDVSIPERFSTDDESLINPSLWNIK